MTDEKMPTTEQARVVLEYADAVRMFQASYAEYNRAKDTFAHATQFRADAWNNVRRKAAPPGCYQVPLDDEHSGVILVEECGHEHDRLPDILSLFDTE